MLILSPTRNNKFCAEFNLNIGCNVAVATFLLQGKPIRRVHGNPNFQDIRILVVGKQEILTCRNLGMTSILCQSLLPAVV